MKNADDSPARLRLDHALDHLAVVLRGMTAREDEVQCACHRGGEEELARLKAPDVELDPDLLHRTWTAPDWSDHGAVLRRILPQFARALVDGLAEPVSCRGEVGASFARGRRREWPAPQAAAVEEFLHAWWARALTEPEPVPVHETPRPVHRGVRHARSGGPDEPGPPGEEHCQWHLPRCRDR
ncbi:hypothetical protein GCM10010275_19850 [Streptomyces litmocidini]|uniref:hypothetical protein n=1 Tax=Streptomyces litmocidini TaxID=67318 RepID=UPI00167E3D61|nr:hypothetical protein [Streptomyces litmocidini]GGU84783.1 hypothetical protein GCM10010275_19850 [Streptomyces litmocidini]